MNFVCGPSMPAPILLPPRFDFWVSSSSLPSASRTLIKSAACSSNETVVPTVRALPSGVGRARSGGAA